MNQEIFTPTEKVVELSAIDTSDIISHLDNYNIQFSMGVTAGRQLLHVLDMEKMKQDNTTVSGTDTSATEDQFAEQLITFEQMKVDTQTLLDLTGLEYQPMRAGWFIAGSEGSHLGSEMRLNLKDGPQLIKYLRSLSPEMVTSRQKDGLNEVAKVLCKQFMSYDLNDSGDDRLLEFMGSISSVLVEYGRIFGRENLSEDIIKLDKYLSYSRNGCLREFRVAEDLLLDKPFTGQGFGLRWHIDATPELLQERWDSVISALHMISQNDKAVEVYGIAKDTAVHALDAAIGDVTSLPGQDRNKEKFLAILNTVKTRMLEF